MPATQVGDSPFRDIGRGATPVGGVETSGRQTAAPTCWPAAWSRRLVERPCRLRQRQALALRRRPGVLNLGDPEPSAALDSVIVRKWVTCVASHREGGPGLWWD